MTTLNSILNTCDVNQKTTDEAQTKNYGQAPEVDTEAEQLPTTAPTIADAQCGKKRTCKQVTKPTDTLKRPRPNAIHRK